MYTFKALLTENGWIENASVNTDSDGNISEIKSVQKPEGEYIDGYAIPGFQNAHSHAFQYAMCGLAEFFEGSEIPDDFWSWREAMYKIALSLSPEEMEDVATMLYAEMLRNGYTSVAEFHYVHHDKNGKKYNNTSELGERLVAAAKNAGIRITLIPMFYQKGNFGTESYDLQRRFISKTVDNYFELLDASKKSIQIYDKANLAIGAHSLRAVQKEDLIETSKLSSQYPFHIHIAEQLKEINDCIAFYGNRPAEWLFENCDVNGNYNLVHCTHLNDNEIELIAKSGANVVLCPSTEGNLGDGRFRFREYQNLGGNWSIGTDSQIGLNFLEDLRILDYGQRIYTHRRDTFFKPNLGDSGFNAIKKAWQSGRKSMGYESNSFFKIGQPLDAVVLDAKAPLIATSSLKNICNTIVYSSDQSHILGTLVSGKWKVINGIHENYNSILENFVKTINRIKLR